jgi:hypothetical protein
MLGVSPSAPARPANAMSELSPDAGRLLSSFLALLTEKNVLLSDFTWGLDRGWTGTLTSAQLAEGMRGLGVHVSDGAFSTLFDWLDQDKNHMVDYFELSSAAALASGSATPSAARAKPTYASPQPRCLAPCTSRCDPHRLPCRTVLWGLSGSRRHTSKNSRRSKSSSSRKCSSKWTRTDPASLREARCFRSQRCA